MENELEDELENELEGDFEDEFDDDNFEKGESGEGESERGEDDVAADNDDDLEDNEGRDDDSRKDHPEDNDADDNGDQGDSRLTLIDEQLFDTEIDEEGFLRIQNRWLILTDKASIAALKAQGFEIAEVSPLEGLGGVLAEIVEPTGIELEDARQARFEVLEAHVEVDYDHLYQPQAQRKGGPAGDTSRQPRSLLSLRAGHAEPIKLGLVDSAIDTTHEVFNNSTITANNFIAGGTSAPADHGTAIASILCGNTRNYGGLLPGTELYSASVFYQDPKVGQRASVKSLVLALNWLVTTGVRVINMSLTGPQNRVLKTALKKLHERGIFIVAAVGNAGPASRPLFPAAYDFVIAVTAVNSEQFAYHLANRGVHVDLSAPGVDIVHATPDGAYGRSSGTSYATPFVSAYLAYQLAKRDDGQIVNNTRFLTEIFEQSKDLGKPGHDNIYGHGLIQY